MRLWNVAVADIGGKNAYCIVVAETAAEAWLLAVAGVDGGRGVRFPWKLLAENAAELPLDKPGVVWEFDE